MPRRHSVLDAFYNSLNKKPRVDLGGVLSSRPSGMRSREDNRSGGAAACPDNP